MISVVGLSSDRIVVLPYIIDKANLKTSLLIHRTYITLRYIVNNKNTIKIKIK